MNQWLSSGAAQPMAGKAAKACQNGWGLWLHNAGICQGSSDFFSFSVDYKILLYETRSLRRWTSHRSRSRPLSARPTRRFLAVRSVCSSWSTNSLPLSGDSLFWELLYKRANLFGVVANATPVFVTRTGLLCSPLTNTASENSTHRDRMSPLRWHESIVK